jgi:hypothetical protein
MVTFFFWLCFEGLLRVYDAQNTVRHENFDVLILHRVVYTAAVKVSLIVGGEVVDAQRR